MHRLPDLGLEGKTWFGPICRSLKTSCTPLHLSSCPSPEPHKHSRKTQHVSWAHILLNSCFIKRTWILLEVRVLSSQTCRQVSGSSTFQVSGTGWDRAGNVSFLRDWIKSRKLLASFQRREICPSWLDWQQRRYQQVTCTLAGRWWGQAAPSSGHPISNE